MKLSERRKKILEASVKHFIETGEPITSERLYCNFDFGIKPAMIRWELNALGDDHYFYQKYPSGGRYPAIKAYRFLVSKILEEDEEDDRFFNNKSLGVLFNEFAQGNKKVFIRNLAQYLKVLSIGYDYESDYLYESGLDELLNNLDVRTKHDLLKVVEDFENLSDRLAARIEWWQNEENWPQVFIGESPITKSEHLSVIAGKLGRGCENLLLIAVGPRRMDYQKSLRLFKSFKNLSTINSS